MVSIEVYNCMSSRWGSIFDVVDRGLRVKLTELWLVLGNPGYGRTGVNICIVVHVMKAAYKYVKVLLTFACYQQHSLGGLTVVYIGNNVFHSSSALYATTVT